MKKAILSLVVMLGLTLASDAQEIPKWFDPLGREARKMVDTTPEQEKEIVADYKAVGKKVAAVRKDNSLSKQEKEKEIKRLRTERANRFFNEILTPEQSTKLREIQKEKNAERQKAIQARRQQQKQQN